MWDKRQACRHRHRTEAVQQPAFAAALLQQVFCDFITWLYLPACPSGVFPAVDADWGSFNMEAAAQAAQPK
jgi:hypothetical protein